MGKTLDIVIPPREARAVIVPRGHVLRIALIAGRQVGDCVFFNANDKREWFHVGQSWALNVAGGTGTSRAFRDFYSKPPRENVMLTTVADTVRNHWGNMGGRCSARWYEIRLGRRDVPNCQSNLERALAPHGVGPDDIGDVFNVFMNAQLTPEGGFAILPPTADTGDYIDLRAEMDVLAAVSACPGGSAATNAGGANPLGLSVSRPA
jgi:hypothetical protein